MSAFAGCGHAVYQAMCEKVELLVRHCLRLLWRRRNPWGGSAGRGRAAPIRARKRLGTSCLLLLRDRIADRGWGPHERSPRARDNRPACRRCLGVSAHPGPLHRLPGLYDRGKSCRFDSRERKTMRCDVAPLSARKRQTRRVSSGVTCGPNYVSAAPRGGVQHEDSSKCDCARGEGQAPAIPRTAKLASQLR
jgi:hypothetical protein